MELTLGQQLVVKGGRGGECSIAGPMHARFLSHALVLTDEQMHDGEDTSDDDSVHNASEEEASENGFAYVLGGQTLATAPSHPPAEVIYRLWQTFVENVNPLVTMVHVPSLEPALKKAVANLGRVPRGFEALMFAIYSTAVLSLTDDECNERLGEPRAMMLPRYVAVTKTALSRARFMSSTSIVVLQALVLHIHSIRDELEPRAVWTLLGAATRIAEGMGMRLDGTLLGLSPFETEIRRRIWWQLRMFDFRAAELSGQAKFRDHILDETTPKRPANVNDSDLYPSMPQAPEESTLPTKMTWSVFRAELATFAASQKVSMQKQGMPEFASEEYAAMDNIKIKDDFIKKMEDMLEAKYLRFCDPSQPLQLLLLLAGRSATKIIRFMAHHPRRWASMDHVPASEKWMVWDTVVQLLEHYNMMRSSPQIRHFAWNAPYYIPWHAIIHVLDTLRADPLHLNAARAWRLIDTLYESNSELLLSTKRSMSMAVGNLCLKAFNARVAALAAENSNPPQSPRYISQLREQREVAKARREVLMARGIGGEPISGERSSAKPDADTILPDAFPSSVEGLVGGQLQQAPAAMQPANSAHRGIRTGDDAFWLGDNPGEDFFAGGPADIPDLDMDAILAQNYWHDTSTGEATDWAQWDVWIGNLEPVRT